MHVHTCSSGTVGGYSGEASNQTLPPAANQAALRANGTIVPSSYQTRALVAHWIHASHGYSGCHDTFNASEA
jgi:hypothetical protein